MLYMHPICHKFLFFLSLLFITANLLSCTNEIKRNEFIIGYAGTFDLQDVEGYATVKAKIEAYKFDEPQKIYSSINSEELEYFRQDIGFASSTNTLTMDEEAFLEFDIEYEGRKTSFSGHIMPELSYDKISFEDKDTTDSVMDLSWVEVKEADYYSIDIVTDDFNSIIWDTVVVAPEPIKFNKSSFQQFHKGIKINVTAVKGPLPNEENYYNLDGDIPGRFLLMSGSYVRYYGPFKQTHHKTTPKRSTLVIENILNRYH